MTIVKARARGEAVRTQIGELKVKDTCIVPHKDKRPFVRYLFEDVDDALVADMKARRERKLDNIVIIEGGEGSGKSNRAWSIISRLDPDFDMERNLIYSMDQFESRLEGLDDKGQVFWLDELYEIASNRSWNSTETKRFVSLLIRNRSRQWTVVMCIPRAKDSDEYLKNHRATYWLMCAPFEFEHTGYKERGYCEVHKKTASGKLQHVGYGEYGEMPEDVRRRYEELKERRQEEDLAGHGGRESAGARYKKKYEDMGRRAARAVLMLRDAGVPRDEICSSLGITQDNYYKMCKRAREEVGDIGGEEED